MLTYFSDRFGPYPFTSYGAIVTDAPFPGALETQTIPVYGKGGRPADPGVERLFSAGVYVRGAWVLHALREAVGDQVFFAILRTFVERFHDGNASTADFIELASELSGTDRSELLNAWLYDDQPPVAPEA